MDTMSVNVASVRSTPSVTGARESARDFLEGLLPPIAAEAADTVVLVVSELVTNALRHGGGTCTLELIAHPGRRFARASPRARVSRRKNCSSSPGDGSVANRP